MNIIDIINKTKNKKELSEKEIRWLIENYTSGMIPDYQMTAWLMAVCLNGLTERETLSLTLAMRDSGEILDLSAIDGVTVDKHSTGGVGDKTTLIIAPAAAACGVYVPKMSGRGLGHTGGTIDKLESIQGYRTEIPFDEFINIVNRTGFSIISQSGNLCPADKKIYSLRNATGTVDSIPLICASIMCKKLAINADCILLDVKYGTGAFMKTKEDARKLADLMQNIGEKAGKKCRAVVTDMNAPLGNNIGNALEIKEVIEILQGKCRNNLYNLCMELTAEMLNLAGKGTHEECRKMAENAISSGKAFEIFRKTVSLHGGILNLPEAEYKYEVRAVHDMKIIGIDCQEIGMVSLLLGAGRTSKDEPVDFTAGIVMNCTTGDCISVDDAIMTLYSSKISDFSEASYRAVRALEFCRI
ncbi:MAG: thymidine phosphorylase [Muribaculaceae bacterium]|nr:thymidine phosphorylase [Alistipes senegalensis]MCM1474562.1 thymidine phosphorylase [Muribaculaceae bacterium]